MPASPSKEPVGLAAEGRTIQEMPCWDVPSTLFSWSGILCGALLEGVVSQQIWESSKRGKTLYVGMSPEFQVWT